MNTWTLEPRDPLIARDGRPSDLGRFASLPFPLPSTLAGSSRTRMGSAEGVFQLPKAEALKLLDLSVHGPLLAELDADADQVMRYFAPAPRDAVLVEAAACRSATRWRLAPRKIHQECATGELSARGLLPVGFAGVPFGEGPREKPLAAAPVFWTWETFAAWLEAPQDQAPFDLELHGLGPLPRERRIHLALEPGERVGVEGAVYETEGLRFAASSGRKLSPRRLALTLRAEEDPDGKRTGHRLALRRELAPLGGERRLARWRESDRPWPALPDAVRAGIVRQRRARLILLTPACFAGGAMPGWNGAAVPGASGKVVATVRGASVDRAVVVSGWDLATQRPKPTRRLAPAGSVYFLEIEGEDAAIEAWCDSLWLHPVSDDEQARRDGFGLAALGLWPEEEA